MPMACTEIHEPVIVIGPGRCGTSAVAGMLHHLGVFMGFRLEPPHRTNPHGHWEDSEFVALNSAVLCERLPLQEWERCVRAIIEHRSNLGIRWGWKDPRTCDLLDRYLGIVAAPRLIRCRRAPDAIQASIVKAYANADGSNGWNAASARRLQQRRDGMLDRLLPRETLDVEFDTLVSRPEAVALRIVDYLGLSPTATQLAQAVSFIQTRQ